ncbi:MAG TPA: c-type cytochrome [bacterium]|nr:c-type cytochrome [bacterium]
MLKTILKILGGLVALLVLGIGGLLGYTTWFTTSRTWDVPYPPIKADTSPAALARGEHIYTAECGGCHADPETGRAKGRWMADVPSFLGVFNSANLTHDEEFGIGKLRDEEIARIIRTGLRRDGHANAPIMPKFLEMSDEDIAAVIGYLRSDADPFKADKGHLPHSKPSLVPGSLIATFLLGPVPSGATLAVHAPEKKVSIEFGRYEANAVHNCWFCHTEGFDPAKEHGPDVYGGGFQLADGLNREIWTRNITPSPEGIGGWKYEDFARALREGVRPDGYLVRMPMPRYRDFDDVEMQAIFAYLQSVPPSHKLNKPGAAPMIKAGPADAKPEALFVSLGCVSCHAKGAPFHDKIKGCLGKPVDQVAAWIRNPEKVKPKTQMPTFADLITVDQATALAAWVQEHPAKEN